MKINQNYIDKNQYSRPGDKLISVKGIVIHWTATPRATASNIRNYFQNLSKQSASDDVEDRSASAHYAIGIDGEIIEIIPVDEVAYHVGARSYKISFGQKSPNNYLIGIELCHKDDYGKFTNETLNACKSLVTELLQEHNLESHNIYRHWDITGKNCPKWFVEHPDEWTKFVNQFT